MKTRIAYCVIGANAAIETVRVLNPPSATTESAWPTASNGVITSSMLVTLRNMSTPMATSVSTT